MGKKEYLYKGKIINLRIDHLDIKHEIIEHAPAVAVLPVDENENILLIKQYRRAADKILIEIPAGLIEKNEKPENCAKRELQEEIGFFPNTLIPLGGFYLSPGFCDEYVYIYIAKDLIKKPLPPDDGEIIETFSVTIEEAIELIENNKIIDAKTISSILRYFHFKKTKK